MQKSASTLEKDLVAPRRGAWIEIIIPERKNDGIKKVAPRRGAGIEIWNKL